jgi:signal peptidase II
VRASGRRLRAYGLAALVVVLDQATKALVVRTIPLGSRLVVLPVLNITCLHNRGAAFSLFGGGGAVANAFFLGLATAAALVFTIWIWRAARGSGGLALVALGLILGGTLGNAVDRVRRGYVVDFIQVHVHGWYYPAFNVADSALTVGAVLLVLAYLRPGRR